MKRLDVSLKRKVFVIEPDSILRDALVSIVTDLDGFHVLESYSAMDAAIRAIDNGLHPDVILTEIKMDGIDGIAGTREILRRLPKSIVVIVSEVNSRALIFNALRAGVTGYILKSHNYIDVSTALRVLEEGGAPMSPAVALKVVKYFHEDKDGALTGREQEVLRLMIMGNTYSQIGRVLNLSKATVKTHQRNIYSKLKLHSKSKVIQYALDNHIV